MLPNNGVSLFLHCLMGFSDLMYVELAGGSRRAAWSEIQKDNTWYLDGRFLLSQHTLSNPTRMAEYSLRKYWKHWSELAESGDNLTFKNTSPRSEQDGSEEEEADQPGREQSAGATDTEEDQTGIQIPGSYSTPTPDQHTSHVERMGFLCSVLYTGGEVYQKVVD